jgi:hypothetical protein
MLLIALRTERRKDLGYLRRKSTSLNMIMSRINLALQATADERRRHDLRSSYLVREDAEE